MEWTRCGAGIRICSFRAPAVVVAEERAGDAACAASGGSRASGDCGVDREGTRRVAVGAAADVLSGFELTAALVRAVGRDPLVAPGQLANAFMALERPGSTRGSRPPFQAGRCQTLLPTQTRAR